MSFRTEGRKCCPHMHLICGFVATPRRDLKRPGKHYREASQSSPVRLNSLEAAGNSGTSPYISFSE